MPLIEDVNRVCADLGIEYFTIANLLIGAAIYHDFVPESDNRSFDICFLRPDYEKFIAYMRKSGSKYNLFLSEYRDNRKKLPHLTKSVSRPEDEGSEVCLRILPFDKSPEEFYMRRDFIEDMQEKNGEYQKLPRLLQLVG